MNDVLIQAVDSYITALDSGVASVHGAVDRTHYFERAAAAADTRKALQDGDLGRAASILNQERRAIGWDWFAGEGGQAAHEAFLALERAVTQARLVGKPPADF